MDSVLAKNETTQEPPHKKFKALFDASDPNKMAVDAPDSVTIAYDTVGTSVGAAQETGSATQSGSSQARGATLRSLDPVAEEEESARPESLLRESAPPPNQLAAAQTVQRTTTTGSQEPRDPNATGGVGEGQVDDAEGQRVPKVKKTGGHKSLDTDQAFLTALASRKRGKKGEDDFDREFNKLRISKPDIHREEEEDWAVLGDFDDDVRNIRGNFMLVVDIDIYRHSKSRGTANLNIAYDGKPNFKKFKKVCSFMCPNVLYLSDSRHSDTNAVIQGSCGVGDENRGLWGGHRYFSILLSSTLSLNTCQGYWKASAKDYTSLPPSNPEAQRRQARTVLESDDDEINDIPVTKKTKKQREPKAKATPLFFDSDEESTQNRGSQQRATRQAALADDESTGVPTRNNKRRHIIADDGSDEDAAFKGFGKKRRLR